MGDGERSRAKWSKRAMQYMARAGQHCGRVPSGDDAEELFEGGVAHGHLAEAVLPEGQHPLGDGRFAVHEVMPITEDLTSLILRRASTPEVKEAAIAQGM